MKVAKILGIILSVLFFKKHLPREFVFFYPQPLLPPHPNANLSLSKITPQKIWSNKFL